MEAMEKDMITTISSHLPSFLSPNSETNKRTRHSHVPYYPHFEITGIPFLSFQVPLFGRGGAMTRV